MGARELLRDMEEAGFRLRPNGDKIKITPGSKLTDGHREALRAVKPELLALLSARACRDCRHQTRVKTCTKPVEAGLLTAEQGFGIVWPPPGYGKRCSAFAEKGGPAKDRGRPYRLARAEADAAHAEPWDDAAIARFRASAAALRRRGFGEQDAEDLAERLIMLELRAEGMSLCLACQHLAGSAATGWICGNHCTALVARELPVCFVVKPQRCPGFARRAGP